MLTDIASDLKYVDGLETVHVHFVGTTLKRRCQQCLRAPVSVREAATSGGAYTTEDVQFSLMRSAFDVSQPPGVGGYVETDDELWSIFGIDKIAFLGQLRLWCKRALIRSELSETLRFDRPVYGKDADLSPSTTWSNYASVSGHIQEVANELSVEQERRQVKVSHRVYCPSDDSTQAGDRVVDSDGNVYHVLRVTGKDILGNLMALDVELARRPQGA